MQKVLKRLSTLLLVGSIAVWTLPTSVLAAKCTAANGASCSCGSGQTCTAWDDWCGCFDEG